MTITDKDDSVLIDLGNHLNKKIKALFAVIAVSAAFVIFVFIVSASISFGVFSAILYLALAIVYCIVFLRFFRRINTKEQLLISPGSLSIIQKSFFRKAESKYDIDKIADLAYNGKPTKTDHPLKGQSFDYFGFETQEHVIQDVHDEGNLSFGYEGAIVRFGKNVYSWDAEKINEVMLRVTSGKLKIDKLPEEMDLESTEEVK